MAATVIPPTMPPGQPEIGSGTEMGRGSDPVLSASNPMGGQSSEVDGLSAVVPSQMNWVKVEVVHTGQGQDAYAHYILKSNQEVNEILHKFATPLNLVSVVGPMRSGKSTLMNFLAGCTDASLFSTAPGGESHTKALGGGQEVQPETSGQKVAFADTEGHGDQGDHYDTLLFTPTLLCSKVIIFNTKEFGQDSVLKQLANLTRFATLLESHKDKSLGALFIIVNRYNLGGDLEKVYILEESVTSEASRRVQNGEQKFLTLDDFEDTYVNQIKRLREHISQKLKTSHVLADKLFTGISLGDFVSTTVMQLNQLEEKGHLSLANVWEQAENRAITKAKIDFGQSIKDICDTMSNDEKLIPLHDCEQRVDDAISQALNHVELNLSHMNPERTKALCHDMEREIGGQKTNFFEKYRVKIKTLARIELAKTVRGVSRRLDAEFPGKLLQIMQWEDQVSSLKLQWLEEYENRIREYDEKALPRQYREEFIRWFEASETSTRLAIQMEWNAWLDKLRQRETEKLSIDLESVSKDAVNATDWDEKAAKWADADAAKEAFKRGTEQCVALAKAKFKREETKVRDIINRINWTAPLYLARYLNEQIDAYKKRFNDAVRPHKDPGSYDTIANASSYRSALEQRLMIQGVKGGTKYEALGDFDRQVQSLQGAFRDGYDTATTNFLNFVSSSVKTIANNVRLGLPNLFQSIKADHDVTLSDLNTDLHSKETDVLSDFDNKVKDLGLVLENAKQHAESCRFELERDLKLLGESKHSERVSAVNDHNRQKLNHYVNQVKSRVIDHKIDTLAKLEEAISSAKERFLAEACGEKDEKKKASLMYSKQSLSMTNRGAKFFYIDVGYVRVPARRPKAECYVRLSLGFGYLCKLSLILMADAQSFQWQCRRSASLYNIMGANNRSSTEAMEKHVISKLTGEVAELAKELGMSWIGLSTSFDHTVHPVNGNKGRRHLLVNTDSVRDDGYLPDRRTNLQFHDWKVEFSDFHFDEPIVQELTPVLVRSFTTPRQNIDALYEMKVSQTEIESIKNTNELMFKLATELVPQLTFTGGFTRWGGQINENPNYLRGYSRERHFDDIANGYTDELSNKARSNQAPWDWDKCMQEQSGLRSRVDRISASEVYEMHVRGKWEGIAGWKHVVKTRRLGGSA
ncbi:hypothetical protein BDV25DRAFT_139881 [Aspergillus avenaceus]|uniref:Guanylate-binding protein N-terminal domain-containing protein n=1 Tax=Aspergillus avenaceus TaxID=36643 RepID=A0A5N6TVI9_ASPAV|nr:hypothetical protein BDV25DRAFT_139881 [Aspergillus avenaceus]